MGKSYWFVVSLVSGGLVIIPAEKAEPTDDGSIIEFRALGGALVAFFRAADVSAVIRAETEQAANIAASCLRNDLASLPSAALPYSTLPSLTIGGCASEQIPAASDQVRRCEAGLEGPWA